MKLQTEIVQKVWTVPSTGTLEEFKNEVNEILEEITDEDDLVNLEFHTTTLNDHGVSTAYITYWTYEFEDDDFDEDELDEDELDEEMEEEEEEVAHDVEKHEVEVHSEGGHEVK